VLRAVAISGAYPALIALNGHDRDVFGAARRRTQTVRIMKIRATAG
jgi:hypothetical protein